MKKILFYLLMSVSWQVFAQSNYCGPYTVSDPIKLTNVSNYVISGKKITNPGGHCIELINCTNVTVQNCMLGPSKNEGVAMENCKNITIINNRMEKIESGAYALTSQGINFSYNEIKNIVGPPDPRGQMCQFDKVTGTGNRINYNRCENIAGQSNTEDIINIYCSAGTSADPIQIYGNWIRGGGPSGSGGGIMIGDGGSSYIIAKDNILVDPGQYGIAIAGGSNIQIMNNKIYGKKQSFTNIGLYVWAQRGSACSNNTVSGNRVNYFNSDGNQNAIWDAGNCPGTVLSSNTSGDAGITAAILPTDILTPVSAPAAAGTITGITSVNQGQSGVVYTVGTITNANSYVWTLPAGATGSSTTNSITVNFSSTAVSGTIRVKGRSSCGDGTESSLAITLKSVTVPAQAPGTPTNLKSTSVTSNTIALTWTGSSTGTPVIPEGSVITAEQASRRYIVFDPNADWNDNSKIIWLWDPGLSTGIDATLFALPTDAKRVLGGTHVIVSATGGGIAMIRVSDKKVMFFAEPAGNPHSLELLPDSNIVVASSEGNKLTLYATGGYPSKVTSKTYAFTGAHGVVWDVNKKVLWSIGTSQLKCYSYNFKKSDPQLTEISTQNLPSTTGHDLSPMYGTDKLFFTTDANVGLYNTVTKLFETYSTLNGTTGVKSISIKDAGGQVLYMKSTTDWWSNGIRFVNGTTKTRTGAEFYKARWWSPNPFSYPADANAITYEVYSGSQKLATVNTAGVTLTGLTPNTSYTLTVKAKDAAGNLSAASNAITVKTLANTDAIAPTAPTGVKTTAVTQTGISVSWTVSTDNTGVVSYEVFKNGISAGTSVTTAFAFSGLTANTSYSIIVKAKDAAGNVSPASTALTVKTLSNADVTAPAAPANLKATSITATSVSLSWSAATDNVGVVSYEVFRNGISAGKTASLSINITGLTRNATYSFYVKAKDAAGNVSPAGKSLVLKTLQESTAIAGNQEMTVSAYPNPCNGRLTIEIPGIGNEQVLLRITDMTGRVIKEQMVNTELSETDLSSFPDGMYMLMITTGTQTRRISILKI